jgi:hypothetical protein
VEELLEASGELRQSSLVPEPDLNEYEMTPYDLARRRWDSDDPRERQMYQALMEHLSDTEAPTVIRDLKDGLQVYGDLRCSITSDIGREVARAFPDYEFDIGEFSGSYVAYEFGDAVYTLAMQGSRKGEEWLDYALGGFLAKCDLSEHDIKDSDLRGLFTEWGDLGEFYGRDVRCVVDLYVSLAERYSRDPRCTGMWCTYGRLKMLEKDLRWSLSPTRMGKALLAARCRFCRS